MGNKFSVSEVSKIGSVDERINNLQKEISKPASYENKYSNYSKTYES